MAKNKTLKKVKPKIGLNIFGAAVKRGSKKKADAKPVDDSKLKNLEASNVEEIRNPDSYDFDNEDDEGYF